MKFVLWTALIIFSQHQASAMIVKDHKVTLEKVDDFAACTERLAVPDCMTALDTWLETHPTDMGMAASLVRTNTVAYNAIPYYQKSFEQKQGNCKDMKMFSAVTDALKLDGKNPLVPKALDIATEKCFSTWKEDLASEVEGKDSHYVKNICPALSKKGALNSDQQKICK